MRLFEKAAEAGLSSACHNYGLCLWRQGDRIQASSMFQQAAAQGHRVAQMNLALMYMEQSWYELALALLQRLLLDDPLNTEITVYTADCRLRQGQPEEAVALYRCGWLMRDPRSTFMFSRCYQKGVVGEDGETYVLPADSTRAQALLWEAAELGAVPAQHCLGLAFFGQFWQQKCHSQFPLAARLAVLTTFLCLQRRPHGMHVPEELVRIVFAFTRRQDWIGATVEEKTS